MSIDQRVAELERRRKPDDVLIVIGTPDEPGMVYVNGKPAPDYRLPDRCALIIANPREPIGGGEAGRLGAERQRRAVGDRLPRTEAPH